MSQEYVSITMIRNSLNDIPSCVLPAPYSFKWYEPGDEKHWLDIQSDSDKYNDITPQLFTEQFSNDAEALAQRQLFLLDADGRAVGTATAWSDTNFNDQQWGRVHWVAIIPQLQGRGLAKPMMSAVCRRLRQLGHESAYLTTAPERISAINLYLKFGFVPVIKDGADAAIWLDIQKEILSRDLYRVSAGEA